MRRLVREIHAVKDTLRDSSARPSGKLSVALPVDGGESTSMINLVTTFASKFPGVQLRLRTINVNQTGIDRLEDGCDVVLQFSMPGANDPSMAGADYVISRLLGTVPMGFVASPEYIAEHGAPDHIDDLARHRCLSIGDGRSSSNWSLRDPSGRVHELPITPAMITDNGPALAALVVAGSGITIMPYHISQTYIEQGLLRPILEEWSPPSLGLHLLWLRSRHLAPRVRAFVDHVQGRLEDLRWLITARA